MTHMIDMSNGRENMAYVGKTPWHGLGHSLQPGASLDTWIKAAGLDWTVSMRPSFYPRQATLLGNASPDGPFIQSADNFHVVRDDTEASLGVMTGRYNPVQPSEVMAFFREFILTDERFQLETAGSLKAGKVIWALAKFDTAMTAGGDAHVNYVLLTTSYNGSLATTAQATSIRVVCNNTLTASIYDKAGTATVKVPHSRKWTQAVQEDAHERLTLIASEFDKYKVLADALAGTRMAKATTEDFLKAIAYGPTHGKPEAEQSGQAKANLDRLFQSWAQTATETEGDTAWAALNAVTRFVDHDRNTRMKGGVTNVADARMASSFYGSGAVIKGDAVRRLAAMAGGLELLTA